MCHWCHDRLLCSAIPEERHDRPELCSEVVGQHCLSKNSRLYGRAIQDDCRRRNVWSVQLVKLFFQQLFFFFILQSSVVSSASQGWVPVVWRYRFSAVCSGSVLRIMYGCEQWLLFLFLFFSRGDGSSGLALQKQLQFTLHWGVRLLNCREDLVLSDDQRHDVPSIRRRND